jgi:hypothetical protein
MKAKARTNEFCRAMLVLLLLTGIAEAAIMPVFNAFDTSTHWARVSYP